MEENQSELTKKERKELRRQERGLEEADLARKKTIRRVLIWLVSVAIIVGAFWGIVKLAGKTPVVSEGSLSKPVDSADNYSGNKDAKTVLVEYSDFQCPACGAFYPIVKQLVADNSSKLKLVYRNFPLQQHANARIAAYAAEAAGKQGKYWEMHDKIFENQNSWSEQTNARDIMIKYTLDLKLNVDQFKKDIDSKEIKDKVDGDYQSGVDSNIDSTPTFFLNGKKMLPPNSFDDFKNQITNAINSAS